MKMLRLRGRKTNEFVQRRGRTWKGRTMIVRWLPGPPRSGDAPGIYIGTYASTKLDKSAVKRNRMRRRCREAFRLALKEMKEVPSGQLLLSPRSPSLTCDFSDIANDVAAVISMLPWHK